VPQLVGTIQEEAAEEESEIGVQGSVATVTTALEELCVASATFFSAGATTKAEHGSRAQKRLARRQRAKGTSRKLRAGASASRTRRKKSSSCRRRRRPEFSAPSLIFLVRPVAFVKRLLILILFLTILTLLMTTTLSLTLLQPVVPRLMRSMRSRVRRLGRPPRKDELDAPWT
jgi:Flp pilus assembly protein TadB